MAIVYRRFCYYLVTSNRSSERCNCASSEAGMDSVDTIDCPRLAPQQLADHPLAPC